MSDIKVSAADAETGRAPEPGWLTTEHRERFDELVARLQGSDTQETISRCHAIAEGYLLGLSDCNYMSETHHVLVRLYLHNLAIAQLKTIKIRKRR